MKNNQDGCRVSLLDATTLLYHVHRGAQLPDQVGFEDCERTLGELTLELAPKKIIVDKSALESALWSANLMSEIGKFWSPTNETFDQFLRRLLKYARPEEKLSYNKLYNYIVAKKPATTQVETK